MLMCYLNTRWKFFARVYHFEIISNCYDLSTMERMEIKTENAIWDNFSFMWHFKPVFHLQINKNAVSFGGIGIDLT